LSGHGDEGPTLEIFSYNILEDRCKTAINRPWFGHITFSVNGVAMTQKAILQAGGQAVGEIVTCKL
jgi:glyoxylase I family protein